MSIGKKILVGLLLVGLAMGTAAGISFAADKTTTDTPAKTFVDGCRGFFGGAADELAKLLGLKQEELIEKRNAGQSLADIAEDQGVKQDKVVSTILKSREQLLDERVKAGVITKEQKDLMLERMQSRIESRIQDPSVGPGAGGGGCGMGGGGCGMGGGAGRGFGPGAGFRNAPTTAPAGI